ncbi:energy transducer TonB family protein [Flavicella marina]|uniref:energy transducer TonB family protein n=1 Tax=Flavicella marina TaxID=1475951 RepID=UPI001264EC8D|nr:energy transducer TonB [Flavicella marina]
MLKKITCSIIILFIGLTSIAQTQKFPVYKGCESSSSADLENCFNKTVKADILENFEVPEVVVSDNFEGTVNVLFFVNRAGNFEVVHVNSPYPELEKEVIKNFKSLPTARPAQFDGRAVEMSFSMPLHFPDPKTNRSAIRAEEAAEASFSKPVEKKELTASRKTKVLEHQSNLNIPFHHSRYVDIERGYIKGENVHTSVKPYTYNRVLEYVDLDAQKSQFLKDKSSWLGRKLWNEHLAKIEAKDFWLTADLLLDVQLGKDNSDVDYSFLNSRILQIQGELGSKFSYSATIYETQGRFAQYVNDGIDAFEKETFSSDGLVFGRGKAKGFKEDSYDFPVSEGYIAYQPNKFFVFQMGQGKNFIGDGYRSMMVSDAAAPYPYFKITTSFWKIQYTNLWMWMTDIRNEVRVGDAHARKYVSSHHLSININKRLNIGLFEAAITDNSRAGAIEMDFLNPIIFYKSLEFNRGEDAGSSVLGINALYKFSKSFSMYSQLVLDEFTLEEIKAQNGYWGNKYGFQIGAKYFDAFKVKNLYLQLEYNLLRPYTFSHGTPIYNYGHFGQEIAHAWGANFREVVFIGKYAQKRWTANLKMIYGLKGFDPPNLNYGGDIYKSYDTRVQDYDNKIGQGAKATILNTDLQVSYLINPLTDLKVFAGVIYRQFSPEDLVNFQEDQTTWFTFGVKVDLFNWYLDF